MLGMIFYNFNGKNICKDVFTKLFGTFVIYLDFFKLSFVLCNDERLIMFFCTWHVGMCCLESDNSKETIGSDHPRKNGAEGLDNP